jgi:RimJ/RimL family protein N-acetyltransferase
MLDPDQALSRRIILSREESNAGTASLESGAIRMPVAAEYSVVEHLHDARPIEIRALRPDDKAEMLAAVGRISTESLRRRFFAPKKGFSEREMAFFLEIDFDNHVALVAEIDEDGRPVIIGGGRYVVVQSSQAEVAFAVVDAYQSQGVGTILMRHLAALARDAGLKELIAEVLPENTAMLKLLRRFGFLSGSQRAHQVAHLTLKLV